MAETAPNLAMERDFSRVVFSLDTVLIPPEKLSMTPSMLEGLDKDVEADLRFLGCELIQTAGILLKLPQVVMATAQVLFQRFYYAQSFIKHDMEWVTMASVVLASKVEEHARGIRDVINVFHHIKQVRGGKTIHPLVLDRHYSYIKTQVIKAELRLLKELGFAVHVKHPHKLIVVYLEVLESTGNSQLVQRVWNLMNDSLWSDVHMRFHPESIACACIYLAARQCRVPLPNNPPWFWLFSVDEVEIRQICLSILKLYTRPKPNRDNLEKIVEELHRKQQLEKSMAKGLVSDQDTPSTSSSNNSPEFKTPNPTSPSMLQAKEKVRENLTWSKTDIHKHGESGSTNLKTERDSEYKQTKQAKKRRNEEGDTSSYRGRSSRSKPGSTATHSSRNTNNSRSSHSVSRSHSDGNKKQRRHDRSSSSMKQPTQHLELPADSDSRHRKSKKQKSRRGSRSHSRSQKRSGARKPSKKSRRHGYKASRDAGKDKEICRDYRERDRVYHTDREYYEGYDYYRYRDTKDRDYYEDRDYHRDGKDRNSHGEYREKDRDYYPERDTKDHDHHRDGKTSKRTSGKEKHQHRSRKRRDSGH